MPDSPMARSLAQPASPDDDGRPDPALVSALAAYAVDPSPERDEAVRTTLATARLLVPVVAVLGEAETGGDGLRREKSSEMAAVLMRGADGRTALVAFTGLEAMRRWDPDARPVAVPATRAAEAALQDGAAALLLDPAGPVRFVAMVRAADDDEAGPGIVR